MARRKADRRGGIPYDLSDVPSVADPSTWPLYARQNGVEPERDRERVFPIYSADELGSFPAVEWLIPRWLAAQELPL